jgi:hypothetical protein
LTEVNATEKVVVFKKCDVSVWDDLHSLVPFARQEFGDIPDVYVAGAGVFAPVRYCKIGFGLVLLIAIAMVQLLERSRERTTYNA